MKDIVLLTTNSRHLNLGFPHGASMPDPNGVLEGDGTAMRHIEIASLLDLERPFVRRYIRTALEQAAPAGMRGAGRSVVRRSVVKSGATVRSAVKKRGKRA